MKNISGQISNLNSIFPWVRERAVNNLVEIGLPAVKEIIAALDTRYAPVITKGLDSSKDSFSEPVRVMKRTPLLLDALVKIGKPAIAELEDALHHPNMNVRLLAMEAIERIGHPSILDLFFPFLDSTEYHERGLAVAELGKTDTPRTIERIVAALDDESSYVRNIAIIALGNLGNPRALPKLKRIAKADKTKVDHVRTIGDVAKEAIEKIHKQNNQ